MSDVATQLRQEMRDKQRQAKERSSASNFVRMWTLTGKNAIAQPGGSVVIRLFPRWDYAQSMVRDAAGKAVANPAYKQGHAFYPAMEHWWEIDKKWNQEYCPTTLDPAARCPINEASAALLASPNQDDRKYGKKLQARDSYLYNAAVGIEVKPNTPPDQMTFRRVDEKGLVDIRPISLSNTLFDALMDIQLGPENAPQFGRGDVTHPRDGFDLVLTRPPANSQGTRWTIQPAPNASPLYSAGQRAAFAGWAERMLDLEEMVRTEMKDYNALYKAFMGRDPDAVAAAAGTTSSRPALPAGPQVPPVAAGSAPVDDDPLMGGQAQATVPESAPLPEGPDDAFMPPPAGARAPRR
jgi:hypothetical protein